MIKYIVAWTVLVNVPCDINIDEYGNPNPIQKFLLCQEQQNKTRQFNDRDSALRFVSNAPNGATLDSCGVTIYKQDKPIGKFANILY